MKVKVLRKFRDKYTKEIYETGQIIDITHERYKEINSTAHGILTEKIEEDIDFDKMTKKELVKYAKEKGIDLDMSMTKKEMIKELM